MLIESTEPVAYAVSRPDPLTVLVDLRNVASADAADQVAGKGPVAGVTLEQATGVDGQEVARVRVALASPAAYKVRSARNVIRLELEPEMPAAFAAPRRDAPHAAADGRGGDPPNRAARPVRRRRRRPTPPPRRRRRVDRAAEGPRRRTPAPSTTITLAGNGRLNPSSLTEVATTSRAGWCSTSRTSRPPRRARTNMDGAFVKSVRVAVEQPRAARRRA